MPGVHRCTCGQRGIDGAPLGCRHEDAAGAGDGAAAAGELDAAAGADGAGAVGGDAADA